MKAYQIEISLGTKILFDNKNEAESFIKIHDKTHSLKLIEVNISDSYYQQRQLVNNQFNKYFETESVYGI